MTIVSQLRKDAAHIADNHAISIVEAAMKQLTHSRFVRLRRRKAIPVTLEEFAYINALDQYVRWKIMLKREEHTHHYVPNRMTIESNMFHWRRTMDDIEFHEEKKSCSNVVSATLSANPGSRPQESSLTYGTASIPREKMSTDSSKKERQSPETTQVESAPKSHAKSLRITRVHTYSRDPSELLTKWELMEPHSPQSKSIMQEAFEDAGV